MFIACHLFVLCDPFGVVSVFFVFSYKYITPSGFGNRVFTIIKYINPYGNIVLFHTAHPSRSHYSVMTENKISLQMHRLSCPAFWDN
jgi:small neutral amino acid transporter SnatA (MarC family)